MCSYLKKGALRIPLGIFLLVMVWHEAGPWTSLAITLLVIGNEATGFIFHMQAESAKGTDQVAQLLREIRRNA